MRELQDAAIIIVGILFSASMVIYANIWATYIIPFGFWQSKATDFKSSGNSSAAIVFLGWVFLLIIAWTTLAAT